MSSPSDPATVSVRRIAVREAGSREDRDRVAVEEPLEIRVLHPGPKGMACHPVAVTMRTPGHDFELAAGFLFTEGVLPTPDAVEEIAHGGRAGGEAGNVVTVRLRPGTPFDASRLSRNVYTSSSCGVCGKTSLEMVRIAAPHPPRGSFTVDPALLGALPGRLRGSQEAFLRTGGLHATGLFDPSGRLLSLREDVGRHNAMDKVIGAAWREGRIPLSDTLAVVSGRTSFELVQKAVMAGIPFLAAVGAPTSLALDLAREAGATLVGFLREGRMNVYTGEERVRLPR